MGESTKLGVPGRPPRFMMSVEAIRMHFETFLKEHFDVFPDLSSL